MKKLFLALLISMFVFPGFCSVIVISDGIWKVAEKMSQDDFLAGQLHEIESLAINGKTLEAAKLCENLREDIRADDVYMDDGEYLPMVLDSMALYYYSQGDVANPEIPDRAEKLIAKYTKIAEGKAYSAYKYLYHRIRYFYYVRKEYSKMISAQKAMILYDPFDWGQILVLLDYVDKYPEDCGSLEKFVEAFKERGGIVDNEFELSLILNSRDKQPQKLSKACQWILKNRLADSAVILRGLPRITAVISSRDKESLLNYYYTLTDLALQQPATEDRLVVFAAALNERQKIETAAPTILPPKD